MSRFYNWAHFSSTLDLGASCYLLTYQSSYLPLSVAHSYVHKLLTPSSASSLYRLAGTLMFPAFTPEPYISLAAILEGKASLLLRLNLNICFWLQFSFPVQMTLSLLASSRPVGSLTCTGITTVRQFPTGISLTPGCSICLPQLAPSPSNSSKAILQRPSHHCPLLSHPKEY